MKTKNKNKVTPPQQPPFDETLVPQDNAELLTEVPVDEKTAATVEDSTELLIEVPVVENSTELLNEVKPAAKTTKKKKKDTKVEEPVQPVETVISEPMYTDAEIKGMRGEYSRRTLLARFGITLP